MHKDIGRGKWDTMVQEFGAEEAERILKQFQVKLRGPGV